MTQPGRNATRDNLKCLISFGVAALFAISAAAAQVAVADAQTDASGAPTGAAIDTTGSYASEVQSCMAGNTGENRATCLREARNAQADKKRGFMNKDSKDFEMNARARCSALSGDDRAACDARMSGYGSVSGSVAGGGVLREVETTVPQR